ncbi:MAG: type IV pili methyl-accepting chemotaxis transducer N-terminal domain-containing protein [Pseudomonadota bacterium]
MKQFIFVVLAIITALISDAPVLHAASESPQVIRQKINLSGRQRMLSQRMSAAACIAMTGLANGERAMVAQSAHDEFQNVLNGLRDGDAALGLPSASSAEVRAALDTVAATWTAISPPVQQLAAGYANVHAIQQIMQTNTDLLRQSNAAVQEIVAKYGGSSIAADMAKAIDIAGRQRMLSQRMVKAACFVFVDIGDTDVRGELSAAITLFDTSLNDLMNGNLSEGIAAPPSPAVAQQLARVAELWQPFRRQLEDMSSGTRAGPDDLLAIAASGDVVLRESNQAVLRYVD